MIYLLTAIGLLPGGSSTVHIYTQTIHRTEKKKRTSKRNVDGRCMSSHENKTFRSRSVAKEKGMVFGFRKTATAVTRPER
jgi:hypothetical protein